MQGFSAVSLVEVFTIKHSYVAAGYLVANLPLLVCDQPSFFTRVELPMLVDEALSGIREFFVTQTHSHADDQ